VHRELLGRDVAPHSAAFGGVAEVVDDVHDQRLVREHRSDVGAHLHREHLAHQRGVLAPALDAQLVDLAKELGDRALGNGARRGSLKRSRRSRFRPRE
jgi:hypothetical protein